MNIVISDNKNEIFKRYNYLFNNFSEKNRYETNILLDIIVNNNWYDEYCNKYPDKFGIKPIIPNNSENEITLSEFLQILHDENYDKIDEIENRYNLDIRIQDINNWYGDKYTIYNMNYKKDCN